MLHRIIPASKTITRVGRRYMGGHGDHHGPNLPPFARLRPPTSKLPIQVENVWDDGVAPETAIDYDAPHISTGEVFQTLGVALGFLYSIYLFASWTSPETSNPVALRSAILDPKSFQRDLGIPVQSDDSDE